MNEDEIRGELEKLHKESFGWTMSCCRRDSSEAENVLQTVYLKVLEGKARFDGRASFKTWLFSVIRLTAIEERRRKWRRWLKIEKYEKHTANTSQVNVDKEIYQSEMSDLLRRLLSELPKRQREVLQLVFYHELSLREAADVMGVSLGTARTHYERGKQKLRRLMGVTEKDYENRKREYQKVVPTTERGR